ncbi:ELF [Pasteurella multocida]|nr:ELF [Pasteurella multocida]
MKKLMIALSLAALFSGVANADDNLVLEVTEPEVNYSLVPVTDGSINFSGSVFSKTCTITEVNQKVKLPEVSQDQFVNGAAGKTNFSIQLGNCTIPQDKSVTLTFNPTKDSVTEDGLLKNKANSKYVSNVLLRLNDSQGRKIDLQPDNSDAPISVGTDVGSVSSVSLNSIGTVAYAFSVEYVKNEAGNIIPGVVEATLPFSISYK